MNRTQWTYYNNVQAARDRFEKRFASLMRRALLVQVAGVASAVEQGLPSPESYLRKEPVEKAVLKMYLVVGVYFAKMGYRQASSLQAKDRASDLVNNWLTHMRTYVSSQTGMRITGITNHTLRIVRSVIHTASVEGWGAAKAARELRKKIATLSTKRAVRIVRTEIMTASNVGSLAGAQYVADSNGIRMQKQWLATPGIRTRDSHRKANGQTVDIDRPFVVNGKQMMQPGDPSGGPSEVVNCRCTIVYRVVD